MKKQKEKKAPLKQRNPYKYYRNQYWGLKLGKWLSVITPFITIFAVKYKDYFVYVANGEQYKLSLGCILALFVLGITMWNESKKDGNGNKQTTPIHTTIGWGVCFALAFLLNSIIQDLTMILGCAFAGQLVSLGFEFGAENRHYYMEQYKQYQIEENAKLSQQQLANRQALGQLTGKHPPIN